MLRIVVPQRVLADLADLLLQDLRHKTTLAVEHGAPFPQRPRHASFHH